MKVFCEWSLSISNYVAREGKCCVWEKIIPSYLTVVYAAFYKSIMQLYCALFTFMGSKFISDQDIFLHKLKIASCKIVQMLLCKDPLRSCIIKVLFIIVGYKFSSYLDILHLTS